MPDTQNPPLFFLRAESREGRFLKEHAKSLQGVVLHARHLAPYPEGSEQAEQGLRGDELAQHVRALKLPHVHDPDTALLPWVLSGRAAREYPRAKEMRVARNLDPFFGPGDFDSEHAIQDLVLDTLAPQREVMMPAPPYFVFSKLDDRWLDVSLRAATEAQRLTRGAPLALFVRADIRALRSGALAHAAARYAERLHARGLAFLAVAGLDTEEAEPAELLAYLHAVEIWAASGFRVIADCVGRFGAAAVGAGAAGMSCGLRYYRTAPDLAQPRHSRSPALRWWAPQRGDRIRLADARRRMAKGTLPPCPVEGCQALEKGAALDDVRLHDIHLTHADLLEAADDPHGLGRRLSSSPMVYVRSWGQALAALLALRKTA